MVRFARSGGEAMAIAVRIARANTGRDRVGFCGYHGWHDWYLAANLAEDHALDGHLLPGLDPSGVPRGLQGTALPFSYNHIEELERIVAAYPDELAAIVMEPVRSDQPKDDFLQTVRGIASRAGAVLIFDEITAGWRLNSGGAHLLYGVEPDMAVFGKAMSNGYAMAAVIGKPSVMKAAQKSFISSTYWTERVGPAAAIATIDKHRRCNVAEHLITVGRAIQSGWKLAAERANIAVEIGGIPPLSHFYFTGELKQEARTLFTQLMLERGFLATNSFYASFSHQEQHITEYLKATEEVFCVIAAVLRDGTLTSLLVGPVAQSGFQRLT
jgi:glutamate-1-semialdehyde 2,1-aminomutase